MSLVANCSRSVSLHFRPYPPLRHCLFYSTSECALTYPRQQQRRRLKKTVLTGDLSWEERLADVVTPLWRLNYDEQLELKQNKQEKILQQLSDYLYGHSHKSKLNFPVLPVLPSPAKDGYRNKSTFSVNRGIDGNPKTVGYYVGTAKGGNIVCVNGDKLVCTPETHKLVARCYQDFIRLSPLEPCLLFHGGGHWREITVRTNTQGHTMAIVYFHPQTLTQEELAVHKEGLVHYFTQGPGSICQLDSLFFQESTMTRCTHEMSPYQLLYGQPHLHEEVRKTVELKRDALGIQVESQQLLVQHCLLL